ncbi:MAG: four helix bundle protein [Gemmatimonadaceae bacterium]
MQDYRRLRVWTKTHAHVLNSRRATHRFPRTGYASLKSQAIRAAESIAFNIVEGCGSASQKELARFLDISIKSASELEYQILLARDYGVLAECEWKSLSEETVDIRRMLCGLRAKVLETRQAESLNHG